MASASKTSSRMSFFKYLSSEVTRGYVLEDDELRYTTRRQRMYTFMKIPRELEKFMSYGFFHCLDSFLFVFTFLPIRFALAALALVMRPILITVGLKKRPFRGKWLSPGEIIDLLKGLLLAFCVYIMSYIDTSMMYHLIKSQSVIKLYLFYNMLEVGDRLFSAFGQDTIDALFWTATEPRDHKRHHIGVIPHFLLAIIYVTLHTLLVLLQATTLNVAVNASNKALLSIMMSNNFVELKGSVFKKFDKTNLFQVSCSDVRERFHLFSLIFIVVVQTVKEYSWKEESFWSLAPDCLLVLCAEFLVDWIKHAFITRFNEVPAEVYKDYTIHLAYDLAQTKQNNALADQCDIVSRRMGFIPLPLGVVVTRVIGTSFQINSRGAPLIFLLAYLCLLSMRVLGSIVILGKACDLIDQHRAQRKASSDAATEKPIARKKGEKVPSKVSAEEMDPDRIAARRMTETSKELKECSITLGAKILRLFGSEAQRGTAEASSVGRKEMHQRIDSISSNLDPVPKGVGNPPPGSASSELCDGTDCDDDNETKHAQEDTLMPISETRREMMPFSSKLNSKPNTTGLEVAPAALAKLETQDDQRDDEEEVKLKSERKKHSREQQQHQWSNRRSQLLYARQLVSDSRRRPLSCTPPSTSTSMDDEDSAASSSHRGQSSMDESSENIEHSGAAKRLEIVDSQASGVECRELPDLIMYRPSNHDGEKGSFATKQQQTDDDDPSSQATREDDVAQSSETDPSLTSKSMSSPDFLKIYQSSNDWPQLDEEEDCPSDEEPGDSRLPTPAENKGGGGLTGRKRCDTYRV